MLTLVLALQVAVAEPSQAAHLPLAEPRGRIAKILRTGDGLSQETAFRVDSVRREYEILKIYGLTIVSQSLVTGPKGKPFDFLTAMDSRGRTVELWFDISSFVGQGF